jgi:hypothetical protein
MLFLTSKKTQRFSITNISCFMLFKEIIPVYSEIRTKPIKTLLEQNSELLIVKAGGTYG